MRLFVVKVQKYKDVLATHEKDIIFGAGRQDATDL
jgi:hypothetical protein